MSLSCFFFPLFYFIFIFFLFCTSNASVSHKLDSCFPLHFTFVIFLPSLLALIFESHSSLPEWWRLVSSYSSRPLNAAVTSPCDNVLKWNKKENSHIIRISEKDTNLKRFLKWWFEATIYSCEKLVLIDNKIWDR